MVEDRIIRQATIPLISLVLFVSNVYGAGYNFISIMRDSQTDFTISQGINDNGQVSGYWIDGQTVEGFIWDNGHFTDIVAPKATATNAYGINNAGQVVGIFATKTDTSINYTLQKKLKTIPFSSHDPLKIPFSSHDTLKIIKPNNINGFPSDATLWGVQGISNDGKIVGYWQDTNSIYHGFLIENNSFISIDFPGGVTFTTAQGVNNDGTVVGWYSVGSGMHGMIYNNGQFMSIDIPGAISTILNGINDRGQIVGTANFPRSVGPSQDSGVLLEDNASKFTLIDFPNAEHTEILGINNHGDITGTMGFFDTSGLSGFIAIRNGSP